MMAFNSLLCLQSIFLFNNMISNSGISENVCITMRKRKMVWEDSLFSLLSIQSIICICKHYFAYHHVVTILATVEDREQKREKNTNKLTPTLTLNWLAAQYSVLHSEHYGQRIKCTVLCAHSMLSKALLRCHFVLSFVICSSICFMMKIIEFFRFH